MSFRLGKRRISVGYEAVAALTAVLLLDRENRMIACFLAAVLHELGHMLMMLFFGVEVRGVSLRLFDIRIEADSPRCMRDDLCITLGGILVNLLLAAAFVPFGRFFGYANLAMGCFNLLPVMTLDGGRLLQILLSCRLSPRTVDVIIRVVSFLILLPLMTAGIFALLQSGYNYSLLVISLYLSAMLILK